MACQFTHLEVGEPVLLSKLGNSPEDHGGCSNYLENCLRGLLKVLPFVSRFLSSMLSLERAARRACSISFGCCHSIFFCLFVSQ